MKNMHRANTLRQGTPPPDTDCIAEFCRVVCVLATPNDRYHLNEDKRIKKQRSRRRTYKYEKSRYGHRSLCPCGKKIRGAACIEAAVILTAQIYRLCALLSSFLQKKFAVSPCHLGNGRFWRVSGATHRENACGSLESAAAFSLRAVYHRHDVHFFYCFGLQVTDIRQNLQSQKTLLKS